MRSGYVSVRYAWIQYEKAHSVRGMVVRRTEIGRLHDYHSLRELYTLRRCGALRNCLLSSEKGRTKFSVAKNSVLDVLESSVLPDATED